MRPYIIGYFQQTLKFSNVGNTSVYEVYEPTIKADKIAVILENLP